MGVELPTDDVYVDRFGFVVRLTPNGSVVEDLSVPGMRGTGVGVDSAAETVYVADSAGEVHIFAPEPPAKPLVSGESASTVTAESATLTAEVNPRSEGGSDTEYRFEYLTEAQFQANGESWSGPDRPTVVPQPNGALPADFGVHRVSVPIEGLASVTAYRFRAVAINSLGTTEGEPGKGGQEAGHTFTTEATGAFALPDGRAWELVSPADKHGASIETLGEAHSTQSSVQGGAITYSANAPTESQPPGYSNLVQVLSTRTSTGWVSRDLTGPQVEATSAVFQGQYTAFSTDLSLGVMQPLGAFIAAESPYALAPGEASEQTAFLHTNFLNDNPAERCTSTSTPTPTSTCYRPLVTAREGFANVPPGTVFGKQNESETDCPLGGLASKICGPRFVGATSELSHVLLESKVALTKTSLPSGEVGLYEWSADAPASEQLQLVSALPGKSEVAAGNLPQFGFKSAVARNAISADGSRVVWTEKQGEKHLYLRDLAHHETVRLDVVRSGSGEGTVEPVFQFASSDGSRVFFTDEQRLTERSGGGGGNSQKLQDLYECQIVPAPGSGELECRLTDLTPENALGEGAEVQDQVLGSSEDGSYVYFVANRALTAGEGAVHGTCNGLQSLPGALCNLYVAHFNGSGWETRLVAVLSSEDFPDWNGDGSENFLGSMTARVSPDGRWLAFMSERGLTGYDTRDAVTGQPDEEVYLYHALASGSGALERGTLACASCDPTGARPVGVPFGDMLLGADGEYKAWGGRSLAASVPTWTTYAPEGVARYQPRYLTDNGRMFFNAPDALVSRDVNGTGDVYEYEQQGTGSCTSASTSSGSDVSKPAHAFAVAGVQGEEPAGCVGLISSGSSPQESVFLDASETGARNAEGGEGGSDVFFLTTAHLSPQDADTEYDVYDAHECTTASPCPSPAATPPTECTNEASCKPAPEPQPSIFSAPASATLGGLGNLAPPPAPVAKSKSLTRAQKLSDALKACKRDKKRAKRKNCETAARKKYGAPKKAKRASQDRRPSR